MAKESKRQKAGESDAEIHSRLNTIVRDSAARLGEHAESVVIIAAYRDSKQNQRGIVWTDGGDYTSYGAAKDFVICAEERMRLGTFAPGRIDPPEWQNTEA